ncbi:MAG: type II toxin-antitoxin system PemK/MazF family toxin [Solirubrobacterales bacterium]|nr:type II toxin-antitoxin system PemK/MazF family toxin [Solirubrobacterales bacterium]
MMRRGEIRLADLEPSKGSEANKRRPCVIVSNDGANRVAERLGRGVVTVVPVTANTDHIYPFQVELPASKTGLPVDSKAQAEQVRSIAVERVGEATGILPASLLSSLDEALRLHLSL